MKGLLAFIPELLLWQWCADFAMGRQNLLRELARGDGNA